MKFVGLSALGQAVTLNVALDGGNFYDAVAGGGTSAKTDQDTEGTIAYILSKRMNVVSATNALASTHTITNDSGVDLPTVNTFLFFNDGIMFAFDGKDTACTLVTAGGATPNVCEGYIDVNGQKGPNKVVKCNSGTGATATAKDTFDATTGVKTEATSCEVGNPTDVYPVFFYDQTVTPATNAAKAVLYGK